MISRQIRLEEIELVDLLTVDNHGSTIYIVDDEASFPYELVSDRQTFFSSEGLFSPVQKNGIKIVQDNRKVSLEELLRNLDQSRQTCVVLIEGFAGCGKSTLVQYILSKQLNTYNYDSSFFNYDLEAQNDLIIRNEEGEIVRKSSILAAIKKCFYEQFIKTAKKNKNVILDFTKLLELCVHYQPFNDLFYKLAISQPYKQCLEYIKDGINNNEHIILDLISKQVNTISSSSCILALDYLFRLALYKNRLRRKLYICYDNLDAIEDAYDLKRFDDILVHFRNVLDNYIVLLLKKHFFGNLPHPHFVIMATYRKITASMANIAETAYLEVKKDDEAKHGGKRSVYHIDATSVFSYKKIVSQRRNFFISYLKNAMNMSLEAKEKIIKNFNSWNQLNQNLEIMQDRYSCLWNKNYRTCSLIANELYSRSCYDFYTHVDVINNSKVSDGYNVSKDTEGNNVLCSYYGGSAIILSSVCKVFNVNHIWDNFLDLAKLNSGKKSYKYVSLSRMVLTYLFNKNCPVSLDELLKVFCKKGLFKHDKLCEILSKMLARNLDGVWRRPIYYYNECILSEDPTEIQKQLLDECNQILSTDTSLRSYKFILCDSGKAYVERLMQEFEFFSNRLSNNNKSLYLYKNIEDIASVINDVYNAVEQCCENMKDFRQQYLKTYNITEEEYLSLEFHPRTNVTHSSQMHTERTIFSHIAYINNVRKYYLDKDVTISLSKRKDYNSLFVKYISKYIELYFNNINIYSTKRQNIAEGLKKKVSLIQHEIEINGNNLETLFMSISL